MKHKENLMYAMVHTKKHSYNAIVDKYSGNRYKVIDCENKALIGKEYKYGHGLNNRRKIKA